MKTLILLALTLPSTVAYAGKTYGQLSAEEAEAEKALEAAKKELEAAKKELEAAKKEFATAEQTRPYDFERAERAGKRGAKAEKAYQAALHRLFDATPADQPTPKGRPLSPEELARYADEAAVRPRFEDIPGEITSVPAPLPPTSPRLWVVLGLLAVLAIGGGLFGLMFWLSKQCKSTFAHDAVLLVFGFLLLLSGLSAGVFIVSKLLS